MARKKKSARQKAATQKKAATRRASGEVVTGRKDQKRRAQSKKRALPQRHGSKNILRRIPRRQKKVAKRGQQPVRTDSKRPTSQSKGSARLVPKSSRPIQRPPITIDRTERTQLKNALDVIRRHVKGYGARDGYAVSDVVRFNRSRQRNLLKKSQTLKELLASPHDIIRPKNEKEKRALRPFARKQLRGAKHYIVHKPADHDRVSLQRGRVRITRKQGRVEIDSIYFMFPHAPYGESDAIEMTEDLLPEMPNGFYVFQTAAHGDTGEPVHRDAILQKLRDYLNTYQTQTVRTEVIEVDDEGEETTHAYYKDVDTGFTGALMGYRFSATTLDGAIVDRRAVDARREAAKAYNEQIRKRNMTDAEKLEAKAEWARKRGRQKRKAAAKKGARTRAAKKAKSLARPVAKRQPRKKTVKKKARAKK